MMNLGTTAERNSGERRTVAFLTRWAGGCLVFLVALFGPGVIHGATRTWNGGGADELASNPANWGGAIPQAVDDVVLNGTSGKHMTWDAGVGGLPDNVASWTQTAAYTGTVTILTVYPGQGAFTEFTVDGDCVISNGVWTHPVNPSSVTNVNNELYRLCVDVGQDMVLGPNGTIDVTGNGYRTRRGPGYDGVAGSYGGRGSLTRGAGPCYGSTVCPTNLGSGGNSSAGGGAVFITSAGDIQNRGAVKADGGLASYYAGSGGSIILVSGTLSGDGSIQANGGTTANYYAGGGGRVALVVTNAGADFSGYSGTHTAYAGETIDANHRGNGGTVYLQKGDDPPGRGELLIDNYGGANHSPNYTTYYERNAALGGGYAVTCDFSRITLINYGILDVGSSLTLVLTNTVLTCPTNTSGIYLNGATVVTPADFSFTNMFIGVTATGTTFSPASSLTVGTNAEFLIDRPHLMSCDIVVKDGGNLSHTANFGYTTDPKILDLTLDGSVTVESDGSINVDKKGFADGNGPVGTGGGHGGCGGNGKLPYGSVIAPTNMGSTYTVRYSGGGGGVVRLNVTGTIDNDGAISAYAESAGSGGSIWLTSGLLTGSGSINAGAPGYGGGRISLTVTNGGADFSGYSGPITAYGRGGGTIYKRTADQGPYEGTLIIDNNIVIDRAAEIGPYVTDACVGNVVIVNDGYLVVETNMTLTVSGMWSNSATYEGRSGSAIVFAGDPLSTSRIFGSTTFMGLTCTNTTGKTLLFEVNSISAIPAYGRLKLRGSETSTNLLLRSTSGGSSWKLNIDALADQNISCVDVLDSDALAGVGAQAVALNSRNSGRNSNWLFVQASPGETNTWNGSANTVWSSPDNWNLGRPPIADDFILIPAGAPRYPVLDNNRTVAGIDLQSGASLSLGGHDFTVNGNAVFSGSVAASGAETMTFVTNVSFSGASVTSALSTVSLEGNGNQTFNPGNQEFYKINVVNSAGTVDFTAGFSATELSCSAPAGARNLRFAHGETVRLRDLVLLGSTATTNIFLRSSSAGQKWRLDATGYRSVRGVNVQDSDASSGLTIHALSSWNNGGNVNWTFGDTPSTWTGTAGVNFHDPNNWDPVFVPDADDRVLMDSANPMSVTGNVTLLDLTVGGSANLSTVIVDGVLTVIENVMVLTNGTLVLNKPCVVSNNVYVLGGGTLTHSKNPNTTYSNKLDLTVHGDMGIDVNGLVDAVGKGHGVWALGSAYGGRGFSDNPCFGSFIAPTSLGQGYAADYAPGGAILLTVSGTLRHDGCMYANGLDGSYRVGSGGSIYIQAGALNGIGPMEANGGVYSGHSGSGGGRISLVVTNAGTGFSGYSGYTQARSSHLSGGTTAAGSGAGSMYYQSAVNIGPRAVCYINNENLTSTGKTDLPPAAPYVTGEVSRVMFRISNAGRLVLTEDHEIGDIWLDSPNAVLDLGFHTLYVNALQHDLGSGIVTNYGEIRWTQGTVFRFW